jgi:uncharacterized protein YlzI (FlbEa/FlbD family)
MPFIKVEPIQGHVSFVNIAAIQSITAGGPEDAAVGPSFVITFRSGQEVVCRGEAEDVRRKIAAAEK